MKTYPIPMVPGPVAVAPGIMHAGRVNYGSADLEDDFFELYARTEYQLQEILGTNDKVVMQTGEGMLALWSAMKSCLVPGDRVLSLATGVFGYGIADMAKSIGCDVKIIGLPYNETISDLSKTADAIGDFAPKMVTVVHCETPSGTLNPLARLGALKKSCKVPLLYVDAVASAGGTVVKADEWNIDLCLGGSQKCLSAPANMAFLSVSDSAWEIIDQVNYIGYDALKPYRTALKERYFPYTPYWHGVAQLNAAAGILLKEGLQHCAARHERVADYCRRELMALGLSLYPAPHAQPSPTVTAVNIPPGVSWQDLDAGFRKRGLVVAGSYGPLAGKIFRMGHMGTQADMDLVAEALDVIAQVL